MTDGHKWRDIENAPKAAVPIDLLYDNGEVVRIPDSSRFDWEPYDGPKPPQILPTHWKPVTIQGD